MLTTIRVEGVNANLFLVCFVFLLDLLVCLIRGWFMGVFFAVDQGC